MAPADPMFRPTLSWARYLYWADLCYGRVCQHFESLGGEPPSSGDSLLFALVSQWYASLNIVLDGWQELALGDPAIDELIGRHPELVSLLRRYRNAVFHYQREFIDPRYREFARADASAMWAQVLHGEFVRFLSDWLARLPGTPDQKQHLLEEVRVLIGWLPEHTASDHLRNLEAAVAQVEALFPPEKRGSQEAAELVAAAEHARRILSEARTTVRQFPGSMVSRAASKD
jgi:hypothetical protein